MDKSKLNKNIKSVKNENLESKHSLVASGEEKEVFSEVAIDCDFSAEVSVPADTALKLVIDHLISALDELATAEKEHGEAGLKDGSEFVLGEKTAFVECLELLKSWKDAEVNGLDFDIEKRYPLK